MGTQAEPFEFHATLKQLEEGMDVLHKSIESLRRSTGRGPDDRSIMLFELAVAEIGANVLTHGREVGAGRPVDYVLRLDAQTARASFADQGPPMEASLDLDPRMPTTTSESGRGLALANSVLDELLYAREGETNMWRLMKRL